MNSRPNIFSGGSPLRDAERRKDPDWLQRARRSPASRYIPVWRSLNLLCVDRPRAVLLSELPADSDAEATIFLGRYGAHLCFAAESAADSEPPRPAGATFESLHRVGALLPAEEASLLAFARGMVLWHRRHRYCGRCGSRTEAEQGGHVLRCRSESCQRPQFPRVDPAIIVLVTDGDRCLLGRQSQWPKGVYSTVAGFVEPGESLEDTVAREVGEETGVQVAEVRYHSSQPWPFPSSLMLGFTATAATTRITRNDEELEDVRWFTRAEIAAGVPILPSRVSISYRLIQDWYDLAADIPLDELDNVLTRW